jgi:hypothetical protein
VISGCKIFRMTFSVVEIKQESFRISQKLIVKAGDTLVNSQQMV